MNCEICGRTAVNTLSDSLGGVRVLCSKCLDFTERDALVEEMTLDKSHPTDVGVDTGCSKYGAYYTTQNI